MANAIVAALLTLSTWFWGLYKGVKNTILVTWATFSHNIKVHIVTTSVTAIAI